MLSLDGCRWDYPDKTPMKNLLAIAQNGVRARSLQPSFPSKTFPNHYTIATGLYPGHHGIVQNSFYAPELGRYYHLIDRKAVEDGAFYGGEPIWVTAEKQGVKSASYFWVGSEAPVKGIRPSIWKRYQHDFPFAQRADSVIAWLQLPPERRPHLITWYMHEPDSRSHAYGPGSPEVKEVLVYIDSLIGDFMEKLARLPIADQVNVIITSDHGMGPISRERVVVLDDYLQPGWLDTALGYNPNFMFKPRPGYMDTVYLALKKAPHLRVWKKGELPARFHYNRHPHIFPIVAVADSGWSVVWRKDLPRVPLHGGTHGYDPADKDMHGIFFATGPAFKKGYVAPTFENVDIYTLIAHILGLKPAPTDGRFEDVKGMLKGY